MDIRLFKIHSLYFLPLIILIFDSVIGDLGANPIEALHIRLGEWTLRFLWLTLAITPLQTITRWKGLAEHRQRLGMYSFFYASLHVFVYVFMDHQGQWRVIWQDMLESRYIWFGFASFVIVCLLAISTPKYAKKRLGKNWKKLHRLIYPASVFAIIHYFWQLKGNLAEPLLYAMILVLLLGFRLLVWFKNRQLSRLMIPASRIQEQDEIIR